MNPPPFSPTPLVRRKLRQERLAQVVLAGMVLAMVLPLVALITYLVVQGAPLLSWSFLTTNPTHGMREGGIWPALLGTIYLVVIALLVAAPVGVLCAIYLNEYAGDNWLTRLIHLAVVNLAGVPSIVHALFGLGAFVLFAGLGRSILAASLTLAIMTLPVIIASTREALAAVPQAFREACWNVGASRWQTLRHVVLPNAISGILTGVILQVSRTAGETAPIMFTGAVFYKKIAASDPFAYALSDQCMALSMHLYTVTTQVTNAPRGPALRHRRGAPGGRAGGQRHRHPPAHPAAFPEEMVSPPPKIAVENLRVSYGRREVLHGLSFTVAPHEILGIIGPAQSGKTTLLRCLNRTLEFIPHAAWSGTVRVDGEDVAQVRDVHALRRKVGMVAPLPVGLPLTIYDNVAFAPRCAGVRDRAELDARVERCLRQAALWDEVKDRLHTLGTRLSGGQQQRLTIARALSHDPEILCLDEFSIAIDPVTTMRIEEVLQGLRTRLTLVLVTNLVQQARRLADRTLFLWNGEIVELDRTEVIFGEHPRDRRTYEYTRGFFG